MSDVDPDLPDFLVKAILDEGPSTAATDLVKQSFSWRTIDTDLMALSFDSAREPVGVRDESATRTFEFIADGFTVVIELDGTRLMGTVVPAQPGSVTLTSLQQTTTRDISAGGLFRFDDAGAGPAFVELTVDGQTLRTPTIVVG